MRRKIEWGLVAVGLFIGHIAVGCFFPGPPTDPPPIPPPEVVQVGYTVEDTPIIFELFAGSVIVKLPDNGTLAVNGEVLTEDDLPYLLVEVNP